MGCLTASPWQQASVFDSTTRVWAIPCAGSGRAEVTGDKIGIGSAWPWVIDGRQCNCSPMPSPAEPTPRETPTAPCGHRRVALQLAGWVQAGLDLARSLTRAGPAALPRSGVAERLALPFRKVERAVGVEPGVPACHRRVPAQRVHHDVAGLELVAGLDDRLLVAPGLVDGCRGGGHHRCHLMAGGQVIKDHRALRAVHHQMGVRRQRHQHHTTAARAATCARRR